MLFLLLMIPSSARAGSTSSASMRLMQDGHFVLDGPRSLGRLAEEAPPEGGDAQHGQGLPGAAEAQPAMQSPWTSVNAHLPWQEAALAELSEMDMDPGNTQTADKADPHKPKQFLSEKPSGWSQTAWEMYTTAYETLSPLRSGHGNTVATLVSMGVGPDNCVLKLAYILFKEEGEDDYPYMPTACGSGFAYLLTGSTQRIAGPFTVVLAVLLGLLGVSRALLL
mmetsp:Transcript_65984/g.204395  ORF Transcript_65984/g.204395 Transcript_65984/m.204395 type:complete len:223 (-) Transcript_65984:78-746(-)